MNKSLYITLALSLSLAACSKNNPAKEIESVDSQVKFEAIVNSGNLPLTPQTKFTNTGALTNQAFSAGDTFIIGVRNNPNGPQNFSETTCVRTITVGAGNTYTPNTPLFWNDLGGRATNAFVWGVYTHGASVTIDKNATFSWAAAADQSASDDYLKSDLLYSNNKTSLVYIPNAAQPTTRDIANLTFQHAMSRVMVNLSTGDGFAATDFDAATVTLSSQFLGIDVNLLSADTIKTPSAATNIRDVKMRKTATNAGYAASFDAIIAPGKVYAAGDKIAVITVNGNTYDLLANAALVNVVGTNGLLKGKYYTFNVKINKQDIGFVATVTDWESGYLTDSAISENVQINIDAVDKGADLTGEGKVPFNNNFDLFQSGDGSNYDSDATATGVNPSTTCSYEDGKWNYNPNIYWQSASDENYFRGLYPDGTGVSNSGSNNLAGITAGDNDYQWGTSGDTKIGPTTGNVKLLFEHKTSQIIVNLKTVTGNASVNLVDAVVEITNTYQTANINIHTGELTPTGDRSSNLNMTFSKVESGVYTYKSFAIPQKLNGNDEVITAGNQTISDDAFVKITLNPNDATAKNEYYFKLNNAVKDGDNIVEWVSNKSYVYNITIKKTGIDFVAQITDWQSGYEGDATIGL